MCAMHKRSQHDLCVHVLPGSPWSGCLGEHPKSPTIFVLKQTKKNLPSFRKKTWNTMNTMTTLQRVQTSPSSENVELRSSCSRRTLGHLIRQLPNSKKKLCKSITYYLSNSSFYALNMYKKRTSCWNMEKNSDRFDSMVNDSWRLTSCAFLVVCWGSKDLPRPTKCSKDFGIQENYKNYMHLMLEKNIFKHFFKVTLHSFQEKENLSNAGYWFA